MEREGDERWGESFECCGGYGEIGGAVFEGDGGDEAERGVGVAGYDGDWEFGGGTVVAWVFYGGNLERFESFELFWDKVTFV